MGKRPKKSAKKSAKKSGAKTAKSKTPFCDFLQKLHNSPSMKTTIRTKVNAVFKQYGISGEHVKALLSDNETKMREQVQAELSGPGGGPHPQLTTGTLGGGGR